MTQTAREEIVGSGAYSFATFSRRFGDILADLWRRRFAARQQRIEGDASAGVIPAKKRTGLPSRALVRGAMRGARPVG